MPLRLFDNDTEPLLTPGFWILPLCRELLNSSRQEAGTVVPVGAWQMATAPRWCTKSDNGHCQARQSWRCSMLAAEFFWLELDDKALLDSYTVLQELCCRAVKMLMTGLTSCCRKRTYGPPLQLGELSQRRF